MFCPKCGNEIQEGSAFCGKCGAPVGGAQQAASSSAGVQAGGVPAPKKNTVKIGIIAAVAVVVVVLVAGFATNWFGLAGVQPKEAVDVPAPAQSEQPNDSVAESGSQADGSSAQAGAAVKSAVEAYTWDELSQISNEIAAAGSEDAAIEVAKRYNLCTPDGKLDTGEVSDAFRWHADRRADRWLRTRRQDFGWQSWNYLHIRRKHCRSPYEYDRYQRWRLGGISDARLSEQRWHGFAPR